MKMMITKMNLEELKEEIILEETGTLYKKVDQTKFYNNEYSKEELIEIITNWIKENPDF